MNLFIFLVLFSGSAFAQTNALDEETYKSKKNAFESKHAEVKQFHKDYWEAQKKLQNYDAELLTKEKSVLSKKVNLSNVVRALQAEKKLKEKVDKGETVKKDTLFVKSGSSYKTIDINDKDTFSEPDTKNSKICYKDNSGCYSFKEEQGKRVFNLSAVEIKAEFENLKAAQAAFKSEINAEEKQRNALMRSRSKLEREKKAAEKKLNKSKSSFVSFVEKKSSGIDEAFVDELASEGKKERLFGAAGIDPKDENTKGKMLSAIDTEVFGKDNYGLIKDELKEYEKADKEYSKLHQDVSAIKEKYNLDSPALKVAKAPTAVVADASIDERAPVDGEAEEIVVSEKQVSSDPIEASAVDEKVDQTPADPNAPVAASTENKDAPITGSSPCGPDDDLDCLSNHYNKLGKEKAQKEKLQPPCTADDNADCLEKWYEKLAKEKICEENGEGCEEVVSDEKIAIDDSPDAICRKEAVAKLMDIFKNDKKNIMEKQLNLTAMKTALYLRQKAGTNNTSLESFVNKNQAELSKSETIEELKQLYEAEGRKEAGKGVDELIAKMKSGNLNYYSKNNRMTNKEASTLYLILSKSNTGVNFGKEDAAIAWAFDEINRFKVGSEEYNKLSVSSNVNKYMGARIAGGKELSDAQLGTLKEKTEKEIDGLVTETLKGISVQCQDRIGPEGDCVLISDIKQDAFAQMIKDILEKQDPQMSDAEVVSFSKKIERVAGKPGREDAKELCKSSKSVNGNPPDESCIADTQVKVQDEAQVPFMPHLILPPELRAKKCSQSVLVKGNTNQSCFGVPGSKNATKK